MKRRAVSYFDMVRCRAYGHGWEDRGWLPMIASGIRVWEQELTCPHCEGKRLDRRAHGTLRLVGRSYALREDYPGTLSQHDALQICVEHDTEKGVAS